MKRNEKMYDEILGIAKPKIAKDYFVRQLKIPIGTKKPYHTYDGKLNDDDFVYLKINLKETTSMVFLAVQGYGKTTIMKRLLSYYWQAGAKCLVFDPKGDDWIMARYMGFGRRMHPKERPIKLPMVGYIPAYVVKLLKDSRGEIPGKLGEDLKQFNIYSQKIEDFREIQDWMNFGLSLPTAMSVLKTMSKTKAVTVKKIMKKVGDSDMHYGTQRAISSRTSALFESDFFTNIYPKINIKRHWNKNEIPSISYYSQESLLTSADTGKIVTQLRDLGYRGNYPKFIVVDDAKVLVGRDMDSKMSSSVQQLNNMLQLWRKLGLSTMFGAQSPSLLDPEILNLCKYIFIGKISNWKVLSDVVGNRQIIEEAKTLDYRPNSHVTQWILVSPNKVDFVKFYSLDARCGNVW